MINSIFNNFINSVYEGGTFEFFDGGLQNIEVVGGAEDISVASIFGGYHSDDESLDGVVDFESDDNLDKEMNNDTNKEECENGSNQEECKNGGNQEETKEDAHDELLTMYEQDAEEDIIVEPMNIELFSSYKNVEEDTGGVDLENYDDRKEKRGAKLEKKKWGGDMDSALSARDVAELLTVYH